ncbi:hypothetical protein RB195_009726 [Necator americanus]|uniref:Peptidase A2 domain-containing protein n=1 Tax=Necator americanus TaxID=51031 RepID=A0ABR1CXZ1_NECAM
MITSPSRAPKLNTSCRLFVMDVSAPVRPPSHSRPTQAYYVPRRLLEGGRGPHPTTDGKPSETFVAATDAPPNSTKPRSNTEVRTPSSKTVVKTYIEPRPLMADLLPKPDSLKEKRRPPRLPQQPAVISQPFIRQPPPPPQPFAPRIVNGPRGPLSRPNAFCPLPPPQKDMCICDRPNTHVICKREYTKQVEYSAIDEETYQKCRSATALLQSSIRQIKEARENLQELYNEVRDEYKNCKNKSERKDLMIEIEQIEDESQLQSAIAEANDLTFMLTARLDETKNMRENMEIKLGYMSLKPQRDNNVNNEENEEGDGEIDNTNENCVRDTTMPSCSQDTSNSASTCNSGTAKRTLRSIKPPQATLPKFYGNSDDFPEYWAIFEALVHNSEELDIMEKILLLKESLKGRAQTAIKGIKLIPENYNWLIKTLQENYSNHQCNRSQIVKKLVSMSVANNSADICSATFDQIRMLTNQMISAGYHVGKTCDPMWCETILSKFPEDIIKSVLVASQSQDRQTVDDLMNLLKTEITAKAYVESRLGHKHINKAIPSKTNHDNLRTNRNCLFCHKDNHVSMQCRTVTDQSIRRKMLKEQNRCWKCCSPNHSSFDCQRSDCLKCGQKHHMSLCFKTEQLSQNNSSKPKFVRVGQNQQRQHSWQNREENNRNIPQRFKPINTQVSVEPPQIKENSIQHSQTSKQLILMTAEGNIWNARKQTYEKVLFFFDSGAQKTVIEENLAQQLGLPKNTTEICTMSGIGGHIECFESHKVPVKLGTAFGEEICMTIQTKPVITNGFPSVKLNTEDIEFLKTNTICLANSKLRGEHQNPHILVGLDYYHDLVTDPANGIRTPSGFHIAKTVFGPTIYGRGISKVSETANTVCHSLTGISENTEQELLQKMFELDGLGIMPEETQGDEKVQRYFEEYSKLISFENNIITAPFPLKENVIQLENNYSVAIRRLESLQNILLCNPEQKQWYCDLVNKYVSEGIVETFDTADRYAAGIYYMPHTGVWKPQKKVPLRIVFDASSKRRGHLSLNDVIRKGESFVNRIHDILTSSRFTKIVLMCDIESAFTQIRLVDAHKDLCRFLWLRNVNHPPTKDNVVEYRFRRLPFGVTACPSILNMAILSYLESQNSELSTEIAENLYVDNILLQAESVPEAVRKYKESKYLFSKIGMNLREYISNSEEVNSRIPYSDKLQSGSMKILGVDYNTITDNFTVRTKFVHNKKLTKRDVVSQINSIYDPIGLTGPLMVKLKSMMREIFDSKVDWKTPLDQKICDEWYKLCKEVDLATLSIPRCKQDCNRSLFILTMCPLWHNFRPDLWKDAIDPKKLHQTIPKLELLGILIAARLGCSILSAVQAKIEEVNIVSDSEIALYWIKSSKKVPVFVANQRAKILSIKQQLDNRGATVKFFHVSTENNPADAGTRGLTAQEIIENDWIKGPRWLENHCSEWPIKSINTLSDVHENDEIETMVTTTLKVTTSENKQQEQLIDLKRFSKIDNVLRVLAKTAKTMKKLGCKNQSKSLVTDKSIRSRQI